MKFQYRTVWALLALYTLLLPSGPAWAAPADVGDTAVPVKTTGIKPQVWAHMVPHGLPDYREGGQASTYGSQYPLDLISGGYWDRARSTSGVPRALAAGLTGMQILQFDWVNKGSDFVDTWMSQADPTWKDSIVTNDFSIAPCFYISRPESLVRMAREYAEVAKGRPSAAKVDGKFLIYIYGPRAMTPDQWSNARRALNASGLPVALVGDLQTDSSQYGYSLARSAVDPYVKFFEASWLFEDSTDKIWPSLLQYLSDRNRIFVGGVMPGYDRETSSLGGYVSPQGTRAFRRQWEAFLATGNLWNNVVTWNDSVERTDIKASSDWNVTRQDINAFFAAKLRGISPPKPRAELYVTSPDYTRIGHPLSTEALVINASSASVNVYAQVTDGSGRAISAPYSSRVGPGAAGDVTVPDDFVLRSFPAGRFVRVKTWMTDATGRTLQSVTSAPTLVYGASEQATSMMRQHFYSIPASKALPVRVALKLTGSPVSAPASSRAVVSANLSVPVRFAEVIQNTRQAGLEFDQASASVKVPMQSTSIIGGQVVDAKAAGFYVGRVIDSNERVGYSDPVFVQ